ncbi:hypothetical protein NQ317_012301 [Molorchus minor]|uniref:DNA topoisomerase (ATP-hydrolyzing) n=1 Tax=Molorchus minor TaxID=1323400 RepID=A0ABQ9J304_9CUCU|nr:hypothetical protein NQ317_012301 [Molorchus minor]
MKLTQHASVFNHKGLGSSSFTRTQVKKFDYLLGLSMWMLTEERKNELLKQKNVKLTELETLKRKSPSDIWREDLDVL